MKLIRAIARIGNPGPYRGRKDSGECCSPGHPGTIGPDPGLHSSRVARDTMNARQREADIPERYQIKYRGAEMPVTVEGKMVDGRTIIPDKPLAENQNEVLVRLKKKSRTRIPVPEHFAMMIAETDIEG